MTELNLDKVLNTLQPVLSEDGRTFSFQMKGGENVLITAMSGTKRIEITATVTQLQQILNNLVEWEKRPCVRNS